MALSVTAVSINVSPLRMDELLTDMFITSAPSRLPASSNEAWVRVETSKNRLISVRPRSELCFFSIWRLRSTKCSARSSRPRISSRERPSIPNRCRWLRTKEGLWAMFIKGGSIGPATPPGKGVGHFRPAGCGWFFAEHEGKVHDKTNSKELVRGERVELPAAGCGVACLEFLVPVATPVSRRDSRLRPPRTHNP